MKTLVAAVVQWLNAGPPGPSDASAHALEAARRAALFHP